MTKDFLRHNRDEFYRGRIFRLIVNNPDGIDAIEIAKQLQLEDKELLAATLKAMWLDTLVYFDPDREKWFACS